MHQPLNIEQKISMRLVEVSSRRATHCLKYFEEGSKIYPSKSTHR